MPFQIKAQIKGIPNKILNTSAPTLIQAKEEAKTYFQGCWKLCFENMETGEIDCDPLFIHPTSE
jgi:hypothetical protein